MLESLYWLNNGNSSRIPTTNPAPQQLLRLSKCFKTVRQRLRCIASDRIHSEYLILEAGLELVAANNDSKEA